MSKRARGVKKCVHYIAFWVRYAFGKTPHLEASRFVVSPLQWFVVQLNGFVVHWCLAEDSSLQ
jgi:hypothetical protein